MKSSSFLLCLLCKKKQLTAHQCNPILPSLRWRNCCVTGRVTKEEEVWLFIVLHRFICPVPLNTPREFSPKRAVSVVMNLAEYLFVEMSVLLSCESCHVATVMTVSPSGARLSHHLNGRPSAPSAESLEWSFIAWHFVFMIYRLVHNPLW